MEKTPEETNEEPKAKPEKRQIAKPYLTKIPAPSYCRGTLRRKVPIVPIKWVPREWQHVLRILHNSKLNPNLGT